MDRWRVWKMGELLQFTRQPGQILFKVLTGAILLFVIGYKLAWKTWTDGQRGFAVVQVAGN